MPAIWPAHDPWHAWTHAALGKALRPLGRRFIPPEATILNVGSAGIDYGLRAVHHIHLDLAEAHLLKTGWSVVGDANRLPFPEGSIGAVCCVGSVLNYCDPAAVCREIARVLKPGGVAMLEFESSLSAEYLGAPAFGKGTVLVNTLYQGRPEPLWLYRPSYVKGLLAANGFVLKHDEGIHLGSALAFAILRDEPLSTPVARLDPLLQRLPGLRALACNRLFVVQKAGQASDDPA